MEIFMNLIYSSAFITFILFISKNWILETMKNSFKKEHSKFLDELQWDRKTKEQASKVAEYLALARQLSDKSTEEDYIKANQLSWELAMWLPEDIYKETVQAIKNPDKDINELTAVIAVRKLLLKENAGLLNQDDIAHHAIGIGKENC